MIYDDFTLLKRTAPTEENLDLIISTAENLVGNVNSLISAYGDANVKGYLNTLTPEPITFACCKRNGNGSVDDKCCNWWGSIKAAVKSSFRCTTPGIGSPTHVVETYYDCVQEVVCETC
jgi:hypothetical protein